MPPDGDVRYRVMGLGIQNLLTSLSPDRLGISKGAPIVISRHYPSVADGCLVPQVVILVSLLVNVCPIKFSQFGPGETLPASIRS